VTLFAMVLPTLLTALSLSKAMGGVLVSITVVAAAFGGILFGLIADRFGRTRALMGSITVYSLFTGACGLARNFGELAFFRVLLGLGFGGEWASGAALVSETWPDRHRGKALGFMQSAWAIGYAAAAVVTAIVLPRWGWRAVFFVGLLPALLTIWVRRRVPEPELWRQAAARADRARPGLAALFRGGLARLTVAVTIMNACTLFGWWAFWSWLPSYLTLPASEGGLGLRLMSGSGLIVTMQIGMWFGYVTFGYVSDAIGRKPAYVGYLLAAAALMLAYTATTSPVALLALGPFVAFFATGYFSGFGTVTAEIYRTDIRATAQGFTYNTGRLASALAPFTVGSLAQTYGFRVALSIAALAFLLAAFTWIWIPETKGRRLE
jgi:MFS family permease